MTTSTTVLAIGAIHVPAQEDFKRIIVMPVDKNHGNIPYGAENIPYGIDKWENFYNNFKLVAPSYGEIIENYPKLAFSVIKVPTSRFNETINALNSMGFYAMEDEKERLLLNDSVSAIGGYYSSDPSSACGDNCTFLGKGRNITIIDSGIDASHPDFNNKIIAWKDFSWESPLIPIDLDGHGTHVAGIAAGTGNASGGKYKGVAPLANLKIARVEDNAGDIFDSWIAAAIDWAVNNSTDVISLSLGSDPSDDKCSGADHNVLYTAIMNAISHNVTVVAAAGNGGLGQGHFVGPVTFPACMNSVIAVGATYKKDYQNHSWNNLFVNTDYDNITFPDWRHVARIHFQIAYVINQTVETVVEDEEWMQPHDPFSGSGLNMVIHVEPSYLTGGSFFICAHWKFQRKLRECGSDPEVSWWPNGPEYFNICKNYSNETNVAIDISATPTYQEWTCPDSSLGYNLTFGRRFNGTLEGITNETTRILFMEVPNLSTKDLTVFFSSRGPAPQNSTLFKPEVTAPGVDICSTRANNTISPSPDCDNNVYYAEESGTSMATPHVAGLVAILKEANPKATPAEIRQYLTNSDKDIISVSSGTLNNGSRYNRILFYTQDSKNIEGYGRINVTKAMSSVPKVYVIPGVVLSPLAQTGAPGQKLSYTFSIKNNNNKINGPSTFLLSSNCPSGWSCQLGQSSVRINPQQTASVILSVTSSSTASSGSYQIYANANDLTSGLTGSISASYNVQSSSGGGGGCSYRGCLKI